MSTNSDNMNKVEVILDKYKIYGNERKEFLSIIKPVFLHHEFQKRFSNDFPHHGTISVSEHVIEDAIKTYLLSKIYIMKKKNNNYNWKEAVYIALFHDLYTVPWQNNKESKVNKFMNLHGFRHPVEAVINSYTWYPDIYKKYDYDKIIDGIVHHMFPLPVIILTDGNNNRELKNYDLFLKLPDKIKSTLIDSTHRKCLGIFSITRSKYMEGRIMSKADKYVSIRQLKNIYDWISLVTGKNKSLKK